MRRRSRMLLERPGVRRPIGSSDGPTLSIRAHLDMAARPLDATPNRCLWLQSLSDFVVGRELTIAQTWAAALPGQPGLGQRFQSRIRPRNLPRSSAAVLCNRHPRNASSRPRQLTAKGHRPWDCLAACGTAERTSSPAAEPGQDPGKITRSPRTCIERAGNADAVDPTVKKTLISLHCLKDLT